jgi:hypothetical protein
MNKKGLENQIFGIFVVFLIFILMLVGLVAYIFIAPLLTHTFDFFNTELQVAFIEASTNETNLTQQAQITSDLNMGLQNLEWISYGLLFAMVMVFLLTAWMTKTYPFLIVFWIIFMIAIVFVSIYISSSYSDLATGNDFVAEAYQSWEGTNYLMEYLPFLLTFLGFLGGIILFVIATRESEAEIQI